ncbi:unnamed protein product [Prunus armeniaca]
MLKIHLSLASDTQVSTSQSQSISSTHESLSPIQHQASLDDILVASTGSIPVLNEQQLQVMFPFEVSDASSSSVSTQDKSISNASSSSVSTQDSSVSLFPINNHSMITRAKNGIVQKQTVSRLKAMKEEIDALHMQGTWFLVPNPVGRYKARLVAQGFSQEPGFDFGETFSPVVRHTTVRLVLSIAAMNQWKLRQLDVKNAFLHGDLEEEAPRAWNAKFTGYLPTLGFKSSHSDPSLFVQHTGNDIIILLLYVDDIIITGSSDQLIQRVVTDLSEISYNSSGDIFVSQTKYSKDLLHKAGMSSCRACATPCKPHTQVLQTDGEPLADPTMFRSLVGALQYLTFTRPDLAYAVNHVCQYMNNPTEVHYFLVKRILRYVQGTLEYGIIFTKGPWQLNAYSDADWAGDINTRRSTTGSVVFLGSNPISWQSKKQGSVSRSSTEAEYRALANTAADLSWIRQVLLDLKMFLPNAPLMYCDNLSALAFKLKPSLPFSN